MTSPDGMTLIASTLFASSLLFTRYRYNTRARRALADEAEDARLTGWVQDLRKAGVEQATDPSLGAVIQRYAQIHGTGRHRVSSLRPATMKAGA